MNHWRTLDDADLPDIRVGDTVRLNHGKLHFTVTRVHRSSTCSVATLDPVEALTTTGRPRPRQTARTDKVTLITRPANSVKPEAVEWDPEDIERLARHLIREEEQQQRDKKRLHARLKRLTDAGIDIRWCPPGTVDDGTATIMLLQWQNGPIISNRIKLDEGTNPTGLLRGLKQVEDYLDDLAAGEQPVTEWMTSRTGAVWRGACWTTRHH